MENSTLKRAILLGIVVSSIGLGCYFGLELNDWVRGILQYEYSLTFRQWVYYVSLWFIVLGAFMVVATALWIAVKGLYRRFSTGT